MQMPDLFPNCMNLPRGHIWIPRNTEGRGLLPITLDNNNRLNGLYNFSEQYISLRSTVAAMFSTAVISAAELSTENKSLMGIACPIK